MFGKEAPLDKRMRGTMMNASIVGILFPSIGLLKIDSLHDYAYLSTKNAIIILSNVFSLL